MDAQDKRDPHDEQLPAPEPDAPDAGALEAESPDAPAADRPAQTPAEAAPPVPPLPRVIGETPLGGLPPRSAPAPVESAPSPDLITSAAATQETARVEAEEDELEPDEAVAVPQTAEAVPPPEPPAARELAPADEAGAAPPASREGEAAPDLASDWDEELSDALSAVLFAGRGAAQAAAARPTPAAESAGRPASARPAPAAAPTPTVVRPEEAAEQEVAPPIQVTDRAGARTLPLTAESRSAPAVDAVLEGQARYRKLAEPLPNGRGQRTIERWDYLAEARPALGARAVTRVRIEGLDYADGSWTWQFERRYADRGVDRRLVRANTDGSYVERSDEVSRLDATTGQRRTYREQARLILAAPEPPEKRGGFLSGLFGREEPPEPSAERIWREAASGESRQGRRGQAFKRGIFG